MLENIATVVIVFLLNWGINTWYNSNHKDKDGNTITMSSNLMQSLLASILAVFVLMLIRPYIKSESS